MFGKIKRSVLQNYINKIAKELLKYSEKFKIIKRFRFSLNGFNAPSASKTASASGFMTRQRSVRKSEVQGHPISASGREIIQFCFENAHPDIGFRICNRLFEKRVDYQV